MQSVSSRIWTRIAVFISYGDNDYTTGHIKLSDGEAPVMLDLWEMWSTPSLPLLPGPLWPRVVAPDRIV